MEPGAGAPPAGAPINRLNRDVSVLELLEVPIVQAPMAGGPSTPALVAAVGGAGGLGFLGAGYLSPQRLSDDIDAVRRVFPGPFGVNVFVGGSSAAARPLVDAYAREIASEAALIEVAPGVPRFDDDDFDAKVDLLCDDPVAVVSFTFGLPRLDAVRRLSAAGSEIWITVTSPEEAVDAAALSPNALIVQGVEAGGHRGIFVDDDQRVGPHPARGTAAHRPGGRVSVDRCRRTGNRSCHRCGPRGRRGCRAARNGVLALPRGWYLRRAAGGHCDDGANRADPRLQRTAGARHREPVPS